MSRQRRNIEHFLRALDYVADPRVGIVKRIEEKLRLPGTPEFYHVYAEACRTERFGWADNFRYTGGAAVDFDRAVAKAVGEAIERYCSAFFDLDELPLHSFEEAPFKCTEPESYALYSPEQYAQPDFYYVPFTRSTPIRWTRCFDPLSGEEVYAPAAMVYIPYYFYENSPEQPVVQPISTGLSCHMGFHEAACSGICEIIERDAFTITWQAGLNPPHIIPESLSDQNYDIFQRFERTGGRATVFNITMDHGVSTILSALLSPSEAMPALAVAAAADPDPEQAVRSSLEELAHTRRYCQLLRDVMPLHDPGPNYEKVTSQASHLGFWTLHSRRELCEFLFTSKQRVEFDELQNLSRGDAEADMETLCRKIGEIGHRVLLTELTTPDVKELGFAVTRAIVPGFHPLFMGYKHRALGGTRLWEIPQKMGYKGIDRETGDNPLPHPFP